MDTAFPVRGRGSVSGVGIGLRDPHFEQLMVDGHGVPWVELLADNFLARGGLQPRQLERIAERFAVTLHCVGMNLGGVDPLDLDYLGDIRRIAGIVDPAWVSDHLCFTSHAGRHYHDLLPLPFSNLPPALALIWLSLGLLERDGLLLSVGLALWVLALAIGVLIALVAWRSMTLVLG